MLTRTCWAVLVTGMLTSSLVSAAVMREEADDVFPTIPSGDVPSASGYPRCSKKWYGIGKELKYWFIDEECRCTDLAAQAVRLPFHDCFPGGGCDGSIILTDECTTRAENQQMIPICQILYEISVEWQVGAADLINFAGCESYSASHANLQESPS